MRFHAAAQSHSDPPAPGALASGSRAASPALRFGGARARRWSRRPPLQSTKTPARCSKAASQPPAWWCGGSIAAASRCVPNAMRGPDESGFTTTHFLSHQFSRGSFGVSLVVPVPPSTATSTSPPPPHPTTHPHLGAVRHAQSTRKCRWIGGRCSRLGGRCSMRKPLWGSAIGAHQVSRPIHPCRFGLPSVKVNKVGKWLWSAGAACGGRCSSHAGGAFARWQTRGLPACSMRIMRCTSRQHMPPSAASAGWVWRGWGARAGGQA
jgi:hypothetical protein